MFIDCKTTSTHKVLVDDSYKPGAEIFQGSALNQRYPHTPKHKKSKQCRSAFLHLHEPQTASTVNPFVLTLISPLANVKQTLIMRLHNIWPCREAESAVDLCTYSCDTLH